jgi:hypothetical protein
MSNNLGLITAASLNESAQFNLDEATSTVFFQELLVKC